MHILSENCKNLYWVSITSPSISLQGFLDQDITMGLTYFSVLGVIYESALTCHLYSLMSRKHIEYIALNKVMIRSLEELTENLSFIGKLQGYHEVRYAFKCSGISLDDITTCLRTFLIMLEIKPKFELAFELDSSIESQDLDYLTRFLKARYAPSIKINSENFIYYYSQVDQRESKISKWTGF